MESERKKSGTVTPAGVVQALWDVFEKIPLSSEYHAQSSLYRALFCDIAQHFPNSVLIQDYSYLQSRIEKEGSPFFLLRLPELGKALETSLVTGEVLNTPRGFERLSGTGLPKFLGQLFRELFEDDGTPLRCFAGYSPKGEYISTHPDGVERAALALTFLRQTCLMYSKVETVGDIDNPSFGAGKLSAKNQKALDSFVDRMSNGVKGLLSSDPFFYTCVKEARRLLRVFFQTACPERDELLEFVTNPWGRQGPGAVAGGEVGCEKWSFKTWPGLPKALFAWNQDLACESQFLEKQPPARLCLVPKDFRGPRVICIEPKENQFAQQGLMDILYRLVHRCALTRRSINFLDTEESRKACYDYRFATIDLKDASDTISLVLARTLLPRWVFKLVTRYRSREIITPSGLIKSGCLATMGNATCFPLETLVFWALSLGTMIALRDSQPRRVQKHLNLEVRVFGDDIIVPIWAYDGVARTLEAAGLLVNTNKSCCFSPVRESCGEWVYASKAIKIVRFKSLDVTDYRSFIQWMDHLHDLGGTVMPALYEETKCRLRVFVHMASGGLSPARRGRGAAFRVRWNGNLQRWEVSFPKFVQLGKTSELCGVAGLYAWHVHNDRTPLPKGARKRVKMGWKLLDDLTYEIVRYEN